MDTPDPAPPKRGPGRPKRQIVDAEGAPVEDAVEAAQEAEPQPSIKPPREFVRVRANCKLHVDRADLPADFEVDISREYAEGETFLVRAAAGRSLIAQGICREI